MGKGHGLIGEEEQRKATALKPRVRRRRERARRRGEAVQERLAQAGDLRPGGAARLAAVVFGAIVHGLTLAVLVGGIALLLSGIWLLYILAALCFGIVWVLRPRLGARPGVGWETRETVPTLFVVLDRIGAETGAPTPKYVKLDASFNAGTGRRGIRQEPTLVLGARLWQVLDGDERLALLGHELGHQVNGDTTQGVLVATARRSLQEWRVLFYPSSGPGPRIAGDAAAGLAQILLPVVLLPFYLLMTGLQTLYGWLQVHVSLRAEFLADDIAAQTASTKAALALLRKLDTRHCVEAYVVRVQFGARKARNAPTVQDAVEMWTGLREYMATIPEHEYIRSARLSEYHGTRVDASHPADYLRVRLLKGRPPRAAKVSVSAEEWAGVDRELADQIAEVGRTMLR